MYSNQVYTCQNCHVCITNHVKFMKHKKECSKYKCLKCKKTFYSEQTFNKHHHNCPPKRYPCPICKKTYSRQSDTNKHVKKHASVRSTFTCHWCACQCLTGKQLELHINEMHSNI